MKKNYMQPECCYILVEDESVLDAALVIASHYTSGDDDDATQNIGKGGHAKFNVFFDDSDIEDEEEENTDDVASW